MKKLARAVQVGALIMVPGAFLLSSCGGSPSNSNAAPPRSTTTLGPTTTSTSTTTTTAPPATTTAALSIVACKTTVAIASPPPSTTLPATASVTVPTDEASYLVVYSDTAGTMMMLGPMGWVCRAEYGADGSGGLLITPTGETIASSPGSGGHVPSSSTAEAIEGYETGASPVQAAALGCPLVSAAAEATVRDLGKSCAPHPATETVFPKTANEVAFYDPPGVAADGQPSGGQDPANGVVLYMPSKGKASAYLATCTLPAVQHGVCTTVLNYYVSLYG